MSREAPPPSYDAVTDGAAPGQNSSHTTGNHNDGLLHPGGADLARTSSAQSDTGGDPFEGLSPEEQREFADEYRDLPEGWVKCWDQKNKHWFYVEEATERSIWVHPYDDPDYLSSLPDSHPANPESAAARERREELEKVSAQAARRHNREQVGGSDVSGTDTDEEGPGMSSRAAMMHDSDQNDKSWFQRQKDKLADKKERRAKRKVEERKQRAEQEKQIRAQVEAYRKKREELIRGQYAAMGSSSSSRYAAPSMAYRSPMGLGPSYGYGYGGGFGRPYGMGYGGYGGYGGGYGYGRPMGMGMGMPLGLGMMGGLGTGMLLGGAMGGGFGGGYGGGDCGGGGDGGGGGD